MFRQTDLLLQMLSREISVNYKGSYLGVSWVVLNPLLKMGLFAFVFGVVFSARYNVIQEETGIDYAIAMFLSLSVFQVIGDSLSLGPQVVLRNTNLVKKVVFPLEILSLASVGASLFNFLVSVGVILIASLITGREVGGFVWLPVAVVPVAIMAVGISWFLAALGVFLRDLSQVTQLLSLVLLYGSAVFYPTSMLPPAAAKLMRLNPVALAIEQTRQLVLWDRPIDLTAVTALYVFSILVGATGLWFFRRTRPTFADVV